jgi:hypothetical protein
MEREEQEFFAEVDRQNAHAKCLFENCPCDGEHGKLSCFCTDSVGGSLWTCPRFVLEKLPADSVMRETYLDLLKGRGWKL